MEGKTAYYLKFKYNGTGNWSFENGETKQQFGAGKVAVKEGNNLVKIKHRERSLKIYVNNEFVYEHTFEYSVDISWWPIYIAGSDKDVVLGLDKAVFKGYSYSTMLLEEMAQKAEKEKLEIESKFIAKGSFPEGKKNYTGTTIPVSFDYNANWKLEDFVNQSWLGATGVELTVSKSEEGGYFLVTTDTTSLSYDGYYKKYVDVNYFTNGIKNNVSDNIIDAEPIINGQKAKMREAFNNDPEINPTGTIELWCLIIKDKRYYMLYAVTFSADRASVLSSFNSFKIN